MTSEYADIKHDFRATFVTAIIILAFFVVSGFLLTAGRGLTDDVFVLRFIIYSILGGAGLSYDFVVASYNYVSGRRSLRQLVHEPEEGLLYDLKVVRNPLLLFLFCFLVFSLPLFFLGRFSNTFLSAVPFAPQQITTFANVWADSIFPSLAENLFIFILLSLVYSFVYARFRKNRSVFWFVNLFVVPLVFAFLWQMFHATVYGSNEVALLSTFFFALIGIFLSMVTMSFIPFAVLHFLTNFMLSLKRYGLMGSDYTVVLLVGFEVLVLLALIVAWRFDKSRVKS